MLAERRFSVEGLQGRVLVSGLPHDKSVFVWVGEPRQSLQALLLAYPPASKAVGPASLLLQRPAGNTTAPQFDDMTAVPQDTLDEWVTQLSHRLATKFSRPILLSFHPAGLHGSLLEALGALKLVEKAILENVSQVLA